MDEKILKKYLPMTETTYYILLNLTVPNHGYGIMQAVDRMTEGKVVLGPGTLYGATTKLVKDGVIIPVEDENNGRKKCYVLTEIGREVLRREYQRMQNVIENSSVIIGEMEG